MTSEGTDNHGSPDFCEFRVNEGRGNFTDLDIYDQPFIRRIKSNHVDQFPVASEPHHTSAKGQFCYDWKFQHPFSADQMSNGQYKTLNDLGK